jgi:CPA2 family monovalent cation:H+ antiporter-2
MARYASIWRWINRRQLESSQPIISEAPEADAGYRAIVVGYGLTGQTLAPLLRDRGIHPTIIEMNLDTVHRVRNQGYGVVYGDATRPEVLSGAGVQEAVGLVVAGPPHEQVAEIIRVARQLNPRIEVLARAHYLREVPVIREAGADEVFSGEGEVALAMTEHILKSLGSTPEQADQERQRVRDELYRRSAPQ